MAMQTTQAQAQALQAIESFRDVYVPHLQAELEVATKDLSSLVEGLQVTASGSDLAIRMLPQAPVEVERDARIVGLLAAGFFVTTWGTRIVVTPVVRAIFRKMDHQQAAKFAQFLLEAMCFGALTCIGFLVVSTQEWVWPSERWWAGFAAGGHEMVRSDTRLYYLMCLAWYLQATFSMLLGLRPTHFWEALLQHLVAVVLIVVSYLWSWNRVGVVVMVLLSPAEVPLHLAKLCQCAADATDLYIWQFATDRFFEIFACIFIVTRLAMYSYVCWSVREEGQHHVPQAGGPAGWACLSLLVVLLLLQCRWLVLIIAKITRSRQHGTGAQDAHACDCEGSKPAGAEFDLSAVDKAGAPEGVAAQKEDMMLCHGPRRLQEDLSKSRLLSSEAPEGVSGDEQEQKICNEPRRRQEDMSKLRLSSSEPPKRPLTPYFLYLRDHRLEISQKLPEGTRNPAVEVAKIAGAQWRALDESTKLRYSQEYKELKWEYDKAKARHAVLATAGTTAASK